MTNYWIVVAHAVIGGVAAFISIATLPKGSPRFDATAYLAIVALQLANGTFLAFSLAGAALWLVAAAVNSWITYTKWQATRSGPAGLPWPKTMGAYRFQARLAWHVFRGRPLAYRIHVEDGGIVFRESRSWAVDSVVVGPGTAFTIRDVMDCAVIGCAAINNDVGVGLEAKT